MDSQPNRNLPETALIGLSDHDVECLLELAQTGDSAAKERLLGWAYFTAHRYYRLKVPAEKALSAEDAEELTTAFFLEFESNLPQLQCATRYTRYVLKQNLRRYLRRKRMRRWRAGWPLHNVEKSSAAAVADEPGSPWMAWSDEDFFQYRAVLQALHETDDTTRRVIQFRLENPPLPYLEIAAHLNLSETAIRMRVTRFYSLVRKIYVTLTRGRSL